CFVFSEDSTHVVYWSANDGTDSVIGEAFVVPVAGGPGVALGAHISGYDRYGGYDGINDDIDEGFRLPLVYREGSELRVFEPEAAATRLLTSDLAYYWGAPDGRHAVYTTSADALMALDTTTLALTFVAEPAFAVSVARDSQSFLFETTEGLFTASFRAASAADEAGVSEPILLARDIEYRVFETASHVVVTHPATLTRPSWAELVRRDGAGESPLSLTPDFLDDAGDGHSAWLRVEADDSPLTNIFMLDLRSARTTMAAGCLYPTLLPRGRLLCPDGQGAIWRVDAP
ncbi:MAG: hypothetical protein HYZ27_10910, partial [Deltaproteobacteria bacterium]|nr:hypothetical protein [Deltaproteobacteria bacterium]